uniref:CCHC-type domain-containing protein n=1 Tax=Tanacetum cinerariifolium TaxID=118510 RepID=A0A699HJ58_TANCI|nr:hypothetical protein [Tanacetum cinerariifolium]
MHKAFPLPVMEFPLSKEVPTASEESSYYQKKRDVTAEKLALLLKSSRNYQSKTHLCYSKICDSYTIIQGNKYKTAQELWAAILKTFGGNKATKKTKKNLLKQQYGNFKVKGSENLEQTFNRLQVIVSQLQFMDVEIKQDDLNQKFLTSLAPEWLMHMIVWRNRSDLDTISLDDLYNHLKVYESEVQKKSEPNSQNMAFISSTKHSSGNEEVNITSGSTASINVSTTTANIGVASISQDTAYAYIASQSSGSQIKFEDINQIDKDDMKEMDIKWNMALLSMRADIFWKKTGKKISIQGTDVAGFDKSKVECFNCHKMGHFAREYRAPRSQNRGRKDNYIQGSKVKEQAPKILAEHRNQELKYCEKIRVLEFKTESRANCIESLTKDLELLKKEKGKLETKLTGFQTASKDLDNLLESQILDKNKEGLGYSVVPPPPAQVYSPPKKDMSWTGLLEFKDDTHCTDLSLQESGQNILVIVPDRTEVLLLNVDTTPRVNVHEFCEEYYDDILPIIMEKVRHDQRKDVHTRLDFGEGPRERIREDSHYSNTRARAIEPEWVKVQDRLRYDSDRWTFSQRALQMIVAVDVAMPGACVSASCL